MIINFSPKTAGFRFALAVVMDFMTNRQKSNEVKVRNNHWYIFHKEGKMDILELQYKYTNYCI